MESTPLNEGVQSPSITTFDVSRLTSLLELTWSAAGSDCFADPQPLLALLPPQLTRFKIFGHMDVKGWRDLKELVVEVRERAYSGDSCLDILKHLQPLTGVQYLRIDAASNDVAVCVSHDALASAVSQISLVTSLTSLDFEVGGTGYWGMSDTAQHVELSDIPVCAAVSKLKNGALCLQCHGQGPTLQPPKTYSTLLQ